VDGETCYFNGSAHLLSKTDLQIQHNPYQDTTGVFAKIEKLALKVIRKSKRPRMTKKVLKKRRWEVKGLGVSIEICSLSVWGQKSESKHQQRCASSASSREEAFLSSSSLWQGPGTSVLLCCQSLPLLSRVFSLPVSICVSSRPSNKDPGHWNRAQPNHLVLTW
jgi:hypothetical protein